MCSRTTKHYQIQGVVIKFVPINVMNMFSGSEFSIKELFSNYPVFQKLNVGRSSNSFISVFSNISTVYPVWIVSQYRESVTLFILSLLGVLRFVVAILTTELSFTNILKSSIFNFKFFITHRADFDVFHSFSVYHMSTGYVAGDRTYVDALSGR